MTKISELEKLLDTSGAGWTDDEEDTLKRYYTRVPMKALLKHFPNRTSGAIAQHVRTMRIRGIKVPQ